MSDLDELRAAYDHPADKSVIELIDRLEQAEQATQPALDETALANLIAWKSLPFGATRFVKLDANAAHKVIELLRPHLAVAQPEVSSVEELDALPPESYVQGWDGFKHAKTHSGDWVLCVEHTRGSHKSDSIELPARVLYLPEVDDA